MKRYLCTVQYIGKNYCGYQKFLSPELLNYFASGRTDAGVNAYAQTFHFDADSTIPAPKVPFAVNMFLPEDIKILDCKQVSDSFNARFDVKKKTYEYNIYVSPVELPVKNMFAYHIQKMPDIDKMKQCANLLVGEHNFKAFMSAGGQSKTFVRKIYSIKIKQKQNDISIEVTGNGFLYNMVRIIVGTLLEVGFGRKTIEDVKNALDTQQRKLAGYLVPAHALFLKSVKYWFLVHIDKCI